MLHIVFITKQSRRQFRHVHCNILLPWPTLCNLQTSHLNGFISNATLPPQRTHRLHRWYRSLCRRLYVSSPGRVFWCTLWHLERHDKMTMIFSSVREAFRLFRLSMVSGPPRWRAFFKHIKFHFQVRDLFFLRWSLHIFRVQGGQTPFVCTVSGSTVWRRPTWTARPQGVFQHWSGGKSFQGIIG